MDGQSEREGAVSLTVKAHLAIQQVRVFLAENFLVILEDAVAGPGTHKVEVAEAGRQAAAHRGSRLQAEFTALWTEATAKGRGHGPEHGKSRHLLNTISNPAASKAQYTEKFPQVRGSNTK